MPKRDCNLSDDSLSDDSDEPVSKVTITKVTPTLCYNYIQNILNFIQLELKLSY